MRREALRGDVDDRSRQRQRDADPCRGQSPVSAGFRHAAALPAPEAPPSAVREAAVVDIACTVLGVSAEQAVEPIVFRAGGSGSRSFISDSRQSGAHARAAT